MMQNFLTRLFGKPSISIEHPPFIMEGVPVEINIEIHGGIFHRIKVGRSSKTIKSSSKFSLLIYNKIDLEVSSFSLTQKYVLRRTLSPSYVISAVKRKLKNETTSISFNSNKQNEITLKSRPLFKALDVKLISKSPIVNPKLFENEPRLL